LVVNFEYDPNRCALLAKIYYPNNANEVDSYSYILAPKNLKILDKIQTVKEHQKNVFLQPGDSSILANFEVGDFIHNVELIPGSKTVIARSAGAFCQILQHVSKDQLKIRLPSGSERLFPSNAKAVLGIVGQESHNQRNLEKAGRSR
jgi:large subunit ribosomal protein L2